MFRNRRNNVLWFGDEDYFLRKDSFDTDKMEDKRHEKKLVFLWQTDVKRLRD